MPFTGAAFACLFLMGGFSLLGKNLLNIAPIVAGGFLYSLYRRESFARYVYLTLYGTCLAPMVSFLLVRTRQPLSQIPASSVGRLHCHKRPPCPRAPPLPLYCTVRAAGCQVPGTFLRQRS